MSDDTVTLHWPKDTAFVDYQTDARYTGEGVYEVPARLEAFYRTRGWTDPPDDFDGDPEQPSSAVNTNLQGPTRDELEGADPAEVMDDNADGENAEDDSSSSDGDADDGGDSGN